MKKKLLLGFVGLQILTFPLSAGTPSVSTNVQQPAAVAPSAPALSSGSIYQLPLTILQKTLDDGTSFVLTTDNESSVVCVVNANGTFSLGKIIVPSSVLSKPVCNTINLKGGEGAKISDNIFGLSSAKTFNWKNGSLGNPDEWYTPSGKTPVADANNPVTGICGLKGETLNPKEIGVAIRGNGTPHQCVFENRTVPLNDPSILVLLK